MGEGTRTSARCRRVGPRPGRRVSDRSGDPVQRVRAEMLTPAAAFTGRDCDRPRVATPVPTLADTGWRTRRRCQVAQPQRGAQACRTAVPTTTPDSAERWHQTVTAAPGGAGRRCLGGAEWPSVLWGVSHPKTGRRRAQPVSLRAVGERPPRAGEDLTVWVVLVLRMPASVPGGGDQRGRSLWPVDDTPCCPQALVVKAQVGAFRESARKRLTRKSRCGREGCRRPRGAARAAVSARTVDAYPQKDLPLAKGITGG